MKLHITDTRCEAVNWITLLRIVFVWCFQEYGNKLSGLKKGEGISLVPGCLLCALEGLCYLRVVMSNSQLKCSLQ